MRTTQSPAQPADFQRIVFGSAEDSRKYHSLFLQGTGLDAKKFQTEFRKLGTRRTKGKHQTGHHVTNKNVSNDTFITASLPDWEGLYTVATNLTNGSLPSVWPCNEILESCPPDSLFANSLCTSAALDPQLVTDLLTPPATSRKHSRDVSASARNATGGTIRRTHKKRTHQKVSRQQLPKGIEHITVSALHAATIGRQGSRCLDFYSAASICAGIQDSDLGRGLRKSDVICHEVVTGVGADQAFYAIACGMDYSQPDNE